MRNKALNNRLVSVAYDLMTGSKPSVYKDKLLTKDRQYIDEKYSSQIASFSVSVAMIGIRPTVAMYYEKGGACVDTHNIVGLIAEILIIEGKLKKDADQPAAKTLFNIVMKAEQTELDTLRKDIIDIAVALKVVLRTFIK